MAQVSQDFWILLILATGIGIMVGIPMRRMIMPLARRGMMTAALGLAGPLIVLATKNLRGKPPRRLHDIEVYLGLLLFGFFVLAHIAFGRGSISRIAEHMIASALYDLPKNLSAPTGGACIGSGIAFISVVRDCSNILRPIS